MRQSDPQRTAIKQLFAELFLACRCKEDEGIGDLLARATFLPKGAINAGLRLASRSRDRKLPAQSPYVVIRHATESCRPWVCGRHRWYPPTGVVCEAGDTLLHAAIKCNRASAAAALLRAGASLAVPNLLGKTPVDSAVEYGRERLLPPEAAPRGCSYNVFSEVGLGGLDRLGGGVSTVCGSSYGDCGWGCAGHKRYPAASAWPPQRQRDTDGKTSARSGTT
ncbi:unnamed protein product [Phaeothamnion confervicola]